MLAITGSVMEFKWETVPRLVAITVFDQTIWPQFSPNGLQSLLSGDLFIDYLDQSQ